MKLKINNLKVDAGGAMRPRGRSSQSMGAAIRAGEGSRGGKIVGHTSSGKPIYMTHGHPSHKEFTAKEHSEAAKAHGAVLKEEEGKGVLERKSAFDLKKHTQAMNFHNKRAR